MSPTPVPLERQEEVDPGQLEGERRVVTMLFCDVQGSTAAAGRLDPEEWTRIINGAFEQMIRPIDRYQGTVARLLGDGLLAFFGAPTAHEDDPQRAVLAGLDIVSGVERYAAQVKADWGMEIRVRVGINTGLVVVGSYGAAAHMEYSALGDAINLAARMEQTAQPGTVQIAEPTYRLVASQFEIQSLGPIAVKGVPESVPAYRVLGRKAEPAGPAGLTGSLTPLVGRQSELSQLHQAVDGLKVGRGGIILLLGETGLGKSRLLRQLRADLEEELDTSLRWISGQGVSYDSGRPYSLFQQFLRQSSGILETDSADVVRQKILESGHQFPFPADLRQQFAEASQLLLATAADGRLEGEALKHQLFETMRLAWGASARQLPLLGVFDDLHWADPASVELLIHLLQLATEVPVLFVGALRPQSHQPAWRIKQAAEADYPHRFAEVNLAPLTTEDIGRLVGAMLNASQLPDELFSTIMLRTGGNPLFVEAVVRDLVDHGILKRLDGNGAWQLTGKLRDITIPEDLRALLSSRLDRLDRDARRTLELASVLGSTFSLRALSQLSDGPAALVGHLGRLEKAGLIVESSRKPELEYSFAHHLARDAAYGSILRSRRQELHRRAGTLLEALYADNLEREAHRLALHFELGNEFRRASEYYTLAGDAAFRLYANEEAIGHYTRALELERGLDFDAAKLEHLYSRLGRAYELQSRFEEALANYGDMETLARERGPTRLLLQALLLQGQILCLPNAYFDLERGKALTDQALRMAREQGDRPAEAKVLWLILNLWRIGGDLDLARSSGEESLAIAQEENLQEQEGFSAHDLGQVYSSLGQPELASRLYERAIARWRELDNRPMLADGLTSRAQEAVMMGHYDQALASSREALEISQAINNLWGQSYSRFGPGMVHWQRGDYGQAVEALELAIHFGELAGFPPSLLIAGAMLAFIRCEMGQYTNALDIGMKALTAFEGFQNLIGMVHLALALVHARLGQLEQAKSYQDSAEATGMQETFVELYGGATKVELALLAGDYRGAHALAADRLALLEAQGFVGYRAEGLLDLAKTLLALGELDAADERLAAALSQAQELGNHRLPWQILAAQAEVAEQQGRQEDAHRLRREAWAAAQYVVEHAAGDEMRESFLSLPAVRTLAEGNPQP